MKREEWRAFMEERRSEIQERQRTLEETIRTSDGAKRDEAEQRLAENTISGIEGSVRSDCRPSLLVSRPWRLYATTYLRPRRTTMDDLSELMRRLMSSGGTVGDASGGYAG